MSKVFSDLKAKPWWWEAAPRIPLANVALPADVDTLIIGSGFSGLCAARVLANAGKRVLVCEQGRAGIGASTRNGGMLGPSFHKLGVAGLKAHYGEQRTLGILRESIAFVDFVRDLIAAENIDCEFQQTGRFRGASSRRHFDEMAREIDAQVSATGIKAEVVSAADVGSEIGSNRFHGGIRYAIDAGLHPAKYHDGLVRSVLRAGATIAENTGVTGIHRGNDGFSVETARGRVRADQIAVCTNAYTTSVTPFFRRRILPIRSSIIATAEIPLELMRELMPTQRMYGDSRRVMAYYRPSPDGRRILFGGRASAKDAALINAEKLRTSMLDVFPQLSNTPITHSWSGLVGYAFDHVPHLGCHDDFWYALGYCGSGVARASFFGTKLGHKMLGNEEQGRTAFDDLPLTTRPFYTGNPWFMAPIIQWHRFLDRLGI